MNDDEDNAQSAYWLIYFFIEEMCTDHYINMENVVAISFVFLKKN